MDFYQPAHVITGNGCIEKNSHLLKTLGKHALVVTGSHSAVRCGALADVTAALEKEQIIWDLFDEIQPNPTVSSCAKAGRFANEKGADMIIGIGGGSPLDAAKAISGSTRGRKQKGLPSASPARRAAADVTRIRRCLRHDEGSDAEPVLIPEVPCFTIVCLLNRCIKTGRAHIINAFPGQDSVSGRACNRLSRTF